MTARYLARSFPVIVVGLVLTVLLPGNATADEGVWIVGPREIPPPLGGSAELRQSIAATPQPDVKAVSDISPATASDWAKIAGPKDKAAEDASRNLAEKWSVQVAAKTVAGVPVFEVIPAKLDPALADKLFVHTHGGAFVFNRGWAGLREAILIAHRVGIPVLSIDYRMPPEAHIRLRLRMWLRSGASC